MKTLVLTGYNDAFAPLGDLTAPRILAYARRHGYDFKCFHHKGTGLETSWHRVQATLDGLIHYERVLWIDADMLITNDAISQNYTSGFNASLDWGKDATEWSHFSTGAYMICQDAADIFSEVLGREEECIAKGIWEQQPIRDQYENYKHLVKIHLQRIFNSVHPNVHPDVTNPWKPGDWACHFTMIPLEDRVRLCKEMM